ncbi:hypothetical protein GOARA_002_00010 [Gordonia araii NBRC 100433]|uniref:Uncharacterized protein n=1 Tax=Gordonia araii NBRC 100433 TaxID=1073574 RepID=G7GX31_9ACTN|nr:hypothetical protein [Gordonia araii]NNG99281.1 hypothetical protein [Gordonia araii NBRC 100433]GAB08156.1 hypothetical protein GOARA_002_00010 [Gordonia araii NBRC 100433]
MRTMLKAHLVTQGIGVGGARTTGNDREHDAQTSTDGQNNSGQSGQPPPPS